MGEQSVSAMMPKFILGVSGASLTVSAPTHPVGRPEARSPRAVALVETDRKFRRDNDELDSILECDSVLEVALQVPTFQLCHQHPGCDFIGWMRITHDPCAK